ncbi:MAG: glycosyltransferase family 2 protein [Desulfosoma sp.]
MGTEKVWVVIPAHNEGASIGDVVGGVRRAFNGAVVVVDDFSTDDTARKARDAGAVVLPLPIHLGAWCATQAGIRYSLAHGCRILVTMDGDGQHRPEDIPRILEPLFQGHSDVVIGSCVDRGSAARRLTWLIFRRITGLDVADLTSGFRAYNRPALKILASREASLLDYQDVGVLLFLKRAGLRFSEVPVTMGPRRNGHSRVFHTWRAVFWYLVYSGIVSVSQRPYPFFAFIKNRASRTLNSGEAP